MMCRRHPRVPARPVSPDFDNFAVGRLLVLLVFAGCGPATLMHEWGWSSSSHQEWLCSWPVVKTGVPLCRPYAKVPNKPSPT